MANNDLLIVGTDEDGRHLFEMRVKALKVCDTNSSLEMSDPLDEDRKPTETDSEIQRLLQSG